MDVTTKCPKCGLMLALDTDQGNEFECPQCGQRLTIQTTATKARPLKRPKPAPRKTASYAPPPASHTDDIDWSIPEIPQTYLRRKRRRSVDLDPAVVWSMLIIAGCVVALIVGGVYFSKYGLSGLSSAGAGRAALITYAPDDWEVQAVIHVGTLIRHPHRNSLLLLGTRPSAAAVTAADDVDEMLISEGAARCMVMTTVHTAPSIDDLRKTGGLVETYAGHEVYRKDGRAVCRLTDKAIAVAENEAAMKRILDAASEANRSPPDLPKEYSAFFRVRTRALKVKTTLPDWAAPFDALGVSVLLAKDGGASLFFFGEATSEQAAKDAMPRMDRLRMNFREQLATLRTLYKGNLNDLEKLSSALANNELAQEGRRVGMKCTVPPDLFGALFQPQLGSFASTTGPPPTTTAAATPPPAATTSAPLPSQFQPPPPPDPAKFSVPPEFVGPKADELQQMQENLAAQFGRKRTVMIVGVGFDNPGDADRLKDQLTDLVKKMHFGAASLNYSAMAVNGWVGCVYAPFDDFDGLAKAIDFATVSQVSAEQRRIFLTPKKG